VGSGWAVCRRPVEVLLSAISKGLVAAFDAGPFVRLSVFVPHRRAFSSLCTLSKHSLLPTSLACTDTLDSIMRFPDIQVTFLWYSPRWSCTLGLSEVLCLCALSRDALPADGRSPHDTTIASWHSSHPTPYRMHHVFGYAARSITVLLDGKHPVPFVVGALSVGNCHAFCACLQATMRHTFIADYSWHFWPRAGDNTVCPCYRAGIDHELGLQGSVDGELLVQPGSPDSELGPQGSVDRERGPPPAYTLTHLLHSTPCACPLLSDLHRDILLNASMSHIFGTEHGGSCLASFILLSQSLLRPLPPRLDPA
jgi:hypothetical protein